jgi:hypothetical protein
MSTSAAESKTSGTRSRRSSSRKGSAATASSLTGQGAFVCPECGKSFSRAQALGAHRSRTHGVAGTSRAARVSGSKRRAAKSVTAAGGDGRSRATSRPRQSGGQFDRDKVLAALFPDGVPPKASVIAALAPWLDEAERLSRMR